MPLKIGLTNITPHASSFLEQTKKTPTNPNNNVKIENKKNKHQKKAHAKIKAEIKLLVEKKLKNRKFKVLKKIIYYFAFKTRRVFGVSLKHYGSYELAKISTLLKKPAEENLKLASEKLENIQRLICDSSAGRKVEKSLGDFCVFLTTKYIKLRKKLTQEQQRTMQKKD